MSQSKSDLRAFFLAAIVGYVFILFYYSRPGLRVMSSLYRRYSKCYVLFNHFRSPTFCAFWLFPSYITARLL